MPKKKSRAATPKSAAAKNRLTIEPEALKAIEAALESLAFKWGAKFVASERAPFVIDLRVFKREAEVVNQNLRKQIELIDGMDEYREWLGKQEKYPDFREIMAKEDEFWKAIEALQPEEGLVGRLIKFGVGDGYANYLITAEVGNKVEVCWIGTGDCWSWNGVDANSMIDRDIAVECVRREDAA